MDIIEGPIGQELNYVLGKLTSRANDLKRLQVLPASPVQEESISDVSQEEIGGSE